MKMRILTIGSLVILCAVVLCVAPTRRSVSAQTSTPIYNPYPPGILPPDLNSEIERVLREVDFVESRALARWHALKPPISTGQPPILKNFGTEAVETLGELMNYDKNIAPEKNQSVRLLSHAICGL